MKLLHVSAIAVLLLTVYNLCRADNPPITPKWAFGHIVWEDSLNTSQSAMNLVGEYLKRDIPVSGTIIDSPWSDSYNDFNWDTDRYPDPLGMINYFRSLDVKVILWLTGALNTDAKDTQIQKNPYFDYVRSHGYAINGGRQSWWWKGNGIHVDFTDRQAKEWWYKQLDKVFIPGVYGWKVDQAEFMFGDTVETSAGMMNNEDFRPFYYDAMYDYTISKNPAGITIARPYSHQGAGFFASTKKMNLGWCGDFSGDWEGIKLQVDNIYRSAQRGYGAITCEVAGFFQQRSDKEQFVRYAQFGAMTAGMINGGENGAFTNHLPWYHGQDVVDIYRFCVVLHQQLIPYLFSATVDCHLNGGSLIKEPSFIEKSHRLGEDIFTKVICEPGGKTSYTLPTGDWVDFWSGSIYSGGSKTEWEYPLDKFPLFIRLGAIIPLQIENAVTGIGNAVFSGKQVFLIYADNGRREFTYHSPRSEGVEYNDIKILYDGINGKLDIRGAVPQQYAVILRNMDKVKDVCGAESWAYDIQNRELLIFASGSDVELTIGKLYP